MNRIERLFKTKDKDILNIYFTAGYPKLEDTIPLILNLEKAGADLVEIGIPYSDPLADGPTIQESGSKAIKNGMTLSCLFEQLSGIRKQTDLPLILMGYFNQIMQFGVPEFLSHCKEVGIDGLILPDLPVYEYEAFYQKEVEAARLAISFLITPQTSEDRIRKIDQLTHGFIYMVSNASITGKTGQISEKQIAYFDRIQQLDLNNPCLIGFGISDQESFRTACTYSNGAIIGSAFIRKIGQAENLEAACRDFVAGIRGETANA